MARRVISHRGRERLQGGDEGSTNVFTPDESKHLNTTQGKSAGYQETQEISGNVVAVPNKVATVWPGIQSIEAAAATFWNVLCRTTGSSDQNNQLTTS